MGKKILIIDDSDDNLQILGMFLRKTDHNYMLISKPEKGVESFKFNGPFDIVFVDEDMPGLKGHEVVKILRDHEAQEGADAALIYLLTGYGECEETKLARDAGCNDVITKPIKKQALLDLID